MLLIRHEGGRWSGWLCGVLSPTGRVLVPCLLCFVAPQLEIAENVPKAVLFSGLLSCDSCQLPPVGLGDSPGGELTWRAAEIRVRGAMHAAPGCRGFDSFDGFGAGGSFGGDECLPGDLGDGCIAPRFTAR